jgi:purine-nucleoside phosphorylase
MDEVDPVQAAAEAAEVIQQRWSVTPRLALILGTGLGELAESMVADVVIDYSQIPHFPRSTAIGHRGRLICGSWHQVPVIAMQGRSHLYEGYSWQQVTLPVRIMAALGIKSLLITNASGGLNPKFQAGDVMVMEDHIDLMFRSPSGCSESQDGEVSKIARPGRVSRPCYDLEFRNAAQQAARRINVPLQTGVYVALTGPTYETRAEYRWLRRIGGDAVGMSTVPEAIMAQHLKMRVLAFSIITNLATPDALAAVTGEDVIETAQAAGNQVEQILAEVLPQLIDC